MIYFLEHISTKKFSKRNLDENINLGQDLDLVQNRREP
jgi:hypothetical protein